MSRELIGIGVLAVACIALGPLFSRSPQWIEAPVEASAIQLRQAETIKAKNPKKIILLSDSFLPKTFAGSELSGYETLRYMKARGHTVCVYVKEWHYPEYQGIPIYKFDMNDEKCMDDIANCDVVFFQMGDHKEGVKVFNIRTKPVYIFIHVVRSYGWQLQNRLPLPCTVVYNSIYTQVEQPTLHSNFIMYPFVATDKFKALRDKTVQNDVVCLINLNKNKGGELFLHLAKTMPDVQFLGVKGGYADQVVDKNPPSNLTYMENQKDITKVFSKIGILMMPSRNETWGRTAVEAMASGVPVIHSESPGLIECVSGAGIMCVRDDEAAWADAIRKIISDRAYREQLRQRGFKRIKDIEEAQALSRKELAYKVEALI